MTYRDYMEEHTTENFSWCKPYTNNEETHYLIVHDGIAEAISTPSIEIQRCDGSRLFEEWMETLAREVHPDYDFCHGWSNQHIALVVMHEIGCCNCPFKYDCEAMGEEMEETDYR